MTEITKKNKKREKIKVQDILLMLNWHGEQVTPKALMFSKVAGDDNTIKPMKKGVLSQVQKLMCVKKQNVSSWHHLS